MWMKNKLNYDIFGMCFEERERKNDKTVDIFVFIFSIEIHCVLTAHQTEHAQVHFSHSTFVWRWKRKVEIWAPVRNIIWNEWYIALWFTIDWVSNSSEFCTWIESSWNFLNRKMGKKSVTTATGTCEISDTIDTYGRKKHRTMNGKIFLNSMHTHIINTWLINQFEWSSRARENRN